MKQAPCSALVGQFVESQLVSMQPLFRSHNGHIGEKFPPPFLTILFFSCFFTFPFTMSMSELSTPSIPTTFYNNHAANITSPSMLSLAQTHSNQSVSCVLTQFRHISEHVESDGSWSEMASMSGNNTKTVCLPRVKLL